MFGKFATSSGGSEPNPDEDILVLDPELNEVEEFEAPMDDPDPELETPFPLLLKEEEDVVAAIGFETLLVVAELGRGSATVTGCVC